MSKIAVLLSIGIVIIGVAEFTGIPALQIIAGIFDFGGAILSSF